MSARLRSVVTHVRKLLKFSEEGYQCSFPSSAMASSRSSEFENWDTIMSRNGTSLIPSGQYPSSAAIQQLGLATSTVKAFWRLIHYKVPGFTRFRVSGLGLDP